MLFGRRIDGFSKSKWRHFIHPRSNLSALRRARVDVRTVWWNVKWRLVDWWRRGVRRLSIARRRCRLRSTWRKVLLTHKLVRLIFLRQNLRSNLNLTLLASARIPFWRRWAGETRRGRCESAEVLSVQFLLEQNRVSMTSAMATRNFRSLINAYLQVILRVDARRRRGCIFVQSRIQAQSAVLD